MGLTPFDVANLNSSIAGVGNSFAERRAEEERKTRDQIELAIRQRMLDAEDRRAQIEQDRADLLGQGNVEATLQGDDGGQFTYRGPKTGLDGILQQAQANGKTLKPVTQPKSTPYTLRMNLEDGQLDLHASSPDELEKAIAQIKKGHKVAPKPESGQYGPIQADKAATDLETQADQLENQANASVSGGGAGGDYVATMRRANKLRERAKFLRSPRYDPSQFETVTTSEDVPPGPGQVSSGKRTTTQRVPAGQSAAVPAPAPAVGKPLDEVTAKAILKEAGGDKDKARSIARQRGYSF